MTKILDKKDKQLLYLLSKDSRQTLTYLGKKVGLAKQNVNYRIKKLFKKGVIRKFDISLNQFLVDYHTFILFIKFQYLTKEKEQRIVAFLTKQEFLTYAIKITGNWDLLLTYITSNISSMNETILKLSEKYGAFIQKKEFLLVNENYSFSLRYFSKAKDESCKISKEIKEKIQLKENEKRLMQKLKKNPGASIIKLAKETSLDYKTVRKLMKKLESKNYILRYGIQVDEKKIGYQDIYCLMRFDNFSKKNCIKLFQIIKKMPNIIFMITTIGPWNVILNFMVEKEENVLDHLIILRNEFSDLLKDYEIIKVDYTIKH